MRSLRARARLRLARRAMLVVNDGAQVFRFYAAFFSPPPSLVSSRRVLSRIAELAPLIRPLPSPPPSCSSSSSFSPSFLLLLLFLLLLFLLLLFLLLLLLLFLFLLLLLVFLLLAKAVNEFRQLKRCKLRAHTSSVFTRQASVAPWHARAISVDAACFMRAVKRAAPVAPPDAQVNWCDDTSPPQRTLPIAMVLLESYGTLQLLTPHDLPARYPPPPSLPHRADVRVMQRVHVQEHPKSGRQSRSQDGASRFAAAAAGCSRNSVFGERGLFGQVPLCCCALPSSSLLAASAD